MVKLFFKNKIKYSLINVMTGSDLSSRRLALMKIESKNIDPVVWLTGCVHGDEVSGIVVIQEIFKLLTKDGLLKGTVCALPLMNPIGFETISRSIALTREDLNRSFPGNKTGTLAERIAETIFNSIIKTEPELVIDLHNDWAKSISYSLIDPYPCIKHKEVYEKVKIFGYQSGLIVINEAEEDLDKSELKKSLSGSMLLHDVPSLTIELGGLYYLGERDVHDGVKSILNILSFLGMVKKGLVEKFYDDFPSFLRNKILNYSHQPLCSKSGIIRFLVKPGEIVKKEQPLVRVYNIFGKLQETLVAQHYSIILGCADSPVALPGFPVIATGVIK